jgi:signal transduction histidine kinase
LLLTLLLGRRIVRPLERLARAAHRYPSQPLADRRLLERRDEIGELARAMTALAADLERRRRETAEVGADVAHELKNPLATIAASAELIASTKEVTDEKRELVSEHILKSVERLRRAIDALLSLLRLEAALPDEPRERLAYRAFVDEILQEYRVDPRYAGMSFRAEVGEGVGEVAVVRARWAEMLRNLLDNAVIQPSERREIVVVAARRGDRVVTEVIDFGPGISPGNRDKIFRRFFTLRPPGAPPGTGLGLSIVEAVAAAHGGSVEVESEPGRTVFRVTLPG